MPLIQRAVGTKAGQAFGQVGLRPCGVARRGRGVRGLGDAGCFGSGHLSDGVFTDHPELVRITSGGGPGLGRSALSD